MGIPRIALTGHVRAVAAGLMAMTVGCVSVLVAHATTQAPIGATESVVICADSSAVLHARAARGGCAAHETALPVMATHSPPAPSADGLDLPDWPTDPPKDAAKGNALTDLEERVARIKKDVGFFTVVDPDGSKIFEVTRDFVHLYSHDSHVSVVGMSALDQGGFLAARSSDSSRVMRAGAVGSSVGIFVAWNDVPRIELARRSGGNFALRVRAIGGGDKNIAAIGESLAGTGAIVVGTRTGDPRASLAVDQGRGAVTIFDEGGAAVASLRQAEAGHGFLSLGKAVEIVKMVVNGDYGVVLAGPVLGFPHVPASGIPGSYLLGCSGGPACHP